MHLAGLSQRSTDLLLGPLQRLEGRLRRHSALLGLLGLAAQARALLGGICAQLLELCLEFRHPSRSRSLVRLLLQRIQPELALAEGAPQIPLGEIEGLRTRPNALGRRPRFGEALAVAAASLLTGRDPLLDCSPPSPHLLEALLDRIPGGADLGELRLGGGQPLLLGAQVVGDDLSALLIGLP